MGSYSRVVVWGYSVSVCVCVCVCVCVFSLQVSVCRDTGRNIWACFCASGVCTWQRERERKERERERQGKGREGEGESSPCWLALQPCQSKSRWALEPRTARHPPAWSWRRISRCLPAPSACPHRSLHTGRCPGSPGSFLCAWHMGSPEHGVHERGFNPGVRISCF